MNNLHALIIDDNDTGIKVLGQMLSALGVEYTAFQDPTHMLAQIENIDPVDVVFLDLEMPKMDGYGVIQILKGELHLDAPVVAYSVYSNELVEVKRLGFDGFLSKPLRKDRFPDQLERILDGQPVWEVD